MRPLNATLPNSIFKLDRGPVWLLAGLLHLSNWPNSSYKPSEDLVNDGAGHVKRKQVIIAIWLVGLVYCPCTYNGRQKGEHLKVVTTFITLLFTCPNKCTLHLYSTHLYTYCINFPTGCWYSTCDDQYITIILVYIP